jgi:hypothetical protein
MIIEKIDNIAPPDEAIVAVKMCGNVAEVKYTQHGNRKPRIKKNDKDTYTVLRTGEIKQYQHGESRIDDKRSLQESLTRLRDYINTNVTDTKKCRWLTLTYKEVMSDPVRLYNDYKAFNRRCRKRYGHYEYVVAAEYQKRGSLHLHCVLIFNKNAPYMDNRTVAELWNNNGFVNIRKLRNVNDVGRYLTAYVGDAFLDEIGRLPDGAMVKMVEVAGASKAVVKGARLALMPPGLNLYRISRGIKPPSVSRMTSADADNFLSDWALTYQSTYRIEDEGREFQNVVSTSFYNRLLGLKEKRLLREAEQEQKILQDGGLS